MLETTDYNIRQVNIEPYKYIDELSSTEFYIGTSKSSNNASASNWRIKRIWQVGTVWKTGFPNGDQNFSFKWDDRLTYVYR